MKRNHIIYYIGVFIIWILYLFLTFNTPQTASSAKLGLSKSTILMLQISFVLPYLFTWWVALYGALHLNDYVQIIKDSVDGKAFSKITVGLYILLISILVTSLAGAVRSLYITNVSVIIPTTIIINYLYVVFPLVAFYFIFSGSTILLKSIKNAKIAGNKKIITVTSFVIFSALYCYLVFTNPNRQTPISVDSPASYYLPDILIIMTIIIPALISWLLGAFSAFQIDYYMRTVKGTLYKKALRNFVVGIILVIACSIILQALLSLGGRLLGLGIGFILVIIYIFFALQALGYIFIALGAKKLTMLEQV